MATMERFTGQESLMWHLEGPDTPMHTLKVAVLDTKMFGRALTLDDVRKTVPNYLGVVPRTTQRAVAVPGFRGRPFWVDDLEFDLDAHLDELTLADESRATLDDAFAKLAETKLDRSRPLWAITLVHGVAGGRQAVVVRLHHAVSDGLAALNTLLAVTTSTPGRAAPGCRPHEPRDVGRRELRRHARLDRARLAKGTLALGRDMATIRRRAGAFEHRSALPGRLKARRSSFNTPSGEHRVCASYSLDLAELRKIAQLNGVTLNGVLHGVLAGAMRAELQSRGEPVDRPAVATFGVSADPKSKRRWGNAVAPSSVYLHIEMVDPRRRLLATALSCAAAVKYRRHVGFAMAERLPKYTARLASKLRALLAHRMPRIVNNITTANVAGPDHRRWIGDIAVVEWISFAVAIAPADVNLTAYSYDGRLSIGLVATPESMPDPASFLARLGAATAELAAVADEGRLHA